MCSTNSGCGNGNGTYYDTLHISPSATDTEIRQAYRKLSMRYHPDRYTLNQSALKISKAECTQMFQHIQHAHETLSHPDKRRRYDATLSSSAPSIPSAPSHPSATSSSTSSALPPKLDENAIASIFANMMQSFSQTVVAGASASISRNMEKPLPIVKTVSLSLDRSFQGGVVPLDIERYCIHNGEKVHEKETVYITLPKGVDDGEMILVENKGNYVSPHCIGDVKVFVRIDPHPVFRREGLDLHFEKWISLQDALCGFEFQCVLPTKKRCHFVSPAGTVVSDHEKKVIEGAGFVRDDTVGNAIITFRVQFPNTLTEDTVNELKKIKWNG